MIVQILCVVIAVILLRWVSTDIMLKEEEKKYFQWSVFLMILVSISELGCGLYDNTIPENRIWCILFNCIGFGVSPFIFLCESNYYSRKHSKWVYFPAIVNLLMVCVSPALGWIFYVTPSCAYLRGPLYFVFIGSFGFSICVSMIRKVKAIKHYPDFFRKRILGSGAVMMGGVLVQVVFPQYHTTWMIICVYFVLHYALLCEISSMVDGLTGLLNKTVFSKQMQDLQKKPNIEAHLLMIDVNDFKGINDKWGHQYGDNCLKEIAAVFKESFDGDATIYRFGGDEFCVVLSSDSKETVQQHLIQLHNGLDEKRRNNKDFPSVAIGYERFYSDVNVHKTIDLADEHMYENKLKMKKCEGGMYI